MQMVRDRDLQTPPIAADKSTQHTKQAPSPSNVEGGDSRTPSPAIEQLQTSPSAFKARETSTASSRMEFKENKPLSLVRGMHMVV